jgi:hypothetical protein
MPQSHCIAVHPLYDEIILSMRVKEYGRKALEQQQPFLAEHDVLDRTFGLARAIVAARSATGTG